jgi:hypothetical protein
MEKTPLIDSMVELLKSSLDAHGEQHDIAADADAPLIGGAAVLSSLALVSYVLDVEAHIDSEFGMPVTLVNEDALSRSKSPFRTVRSLAEYVLELAGVADAEEDPGLEPRVARA